MEYTVVIYGYTSANERVDSTVKTKAESPQMAILKCCGMSSRALYWKGKGYLDIDQYSDDVTIYGYEVMR